MNRLAFKVHLEEHVKLSILRVNVEDMLKVHLGSVFVPHGLDTCWGLMWGGYPEVRRVLKILSVFSPPPCLLLRT